MKTAEVCRKHGISEPTFYAWKAKFGGMSVPDARQLKQLEEENTRLKKLLAEAMLDNAVLKSLPRTWLRTLLTPGGVSGAQVTQIRPGRKATRADPR